jgi:hypothetical protein
MQQNELVNLFLDTCQRLLTVFEEKNNLDERVKVIRSKELPDDLRDCAGYIVESTNLSGVRPFSRFFYVLSEIEVTRVFRVFASNLTYSFYYAIHKKSGKIIVVDDEGDEAYEAAKSVESFLEVLIELMLFEISQIDGHVHDDASRNACLRKCIALAGGDQFSEYYKILL